MLIEKTFVDVPVTHGSRPMRIFIIAPKIEGYPKAKFPGVVVFSEIYQVTGPVERMAGQIASQGYVVACPSSYHEFEGPEPLAYDADGTDRGNKYKIEKELAAYDEDSSLAIDTLMKHPNCTGRIGATGICLGGHLAFRASLDPRTLATTCWYGTDIHSATLGKGKQDDSLLRAKRGDIKGEIIMIYGRQDPHVPPAGRTLIRQTLEESRTSYSFLEVQGQHAFTRDEESKGRWDAALTRNLFGMMMELFDRVLARDLGQREGPVADPEDVC